VTRQYESLGLAALELLAGWRGRRGWGWRRMSGAGDGSGRLSSRDRRRRTSSRGLQQRRREARDLKQGRLLQVDGIARHAAAAGRGRADAQGRRRVGAVPARRGRGRGGGGAVGSEGPERERACERDQRESVHVIAHPYSDLGHTAKIFYFFLFSN